MTAAVHEAALFLLARRWVPVRVAGKRPVGEEWPLLRPTAEDIKRWPSGSNLGVLLGTASGGLTDVDLDCAEAIALAPSYLPETWTFGRASKRRSHYLYSCQGARSHAFTFGDGKDKVTMLEIRADTANGPGHQTVIPPSVHYPTGEPIEWDPDLADGTDGPRVIEWRDLVAAVASLARATVAMLDGATIDEAREFARTYKATATAVQPARHGARVASVGPDIIERARAYVDKMPPAISGSGGHDSTYAVALVLVRGFDLDDATALDILADFNARCTPPWSDAELAHKVAAARKAARVPAGYLLDGERRRA